jgi:hypothetical protein
MPGTNPRWLYVVTVVSVAVLAGMLWRFRCEALGICRRPTPVVAACPEHKINIVTEHGTTVTTIPVAPNIATIPEFHDCQRFLVKPITQPTVGPAFGVHTSGSDAVTYGPLVAIWVAEAADTFQWSPGPDSTAPADSGVVNGSSGDPMMGGSINAVANAVAEIYSWGPETYAPLFIRPGFSCLYMWRDSGPPHTWRAMLVWLDASPTPCHGPKRVAELDQGAMLEVRPVVADEFTKGDIPPVARWDRDPGRGHQYIGIKCGAQWCEVGPHGFGSSRPAANEAFAGAVNDAMEERPGGSAPMPSLQRQRVLAVKGWYDQQMLASLGTTGMGPSGIVGTIIPHPLVQGDYLTAASFESTWVQVAFVHVDGPYENKHHLQLAQGVTEMHFCKGTAEHCGIPAGANACKATSAVTNPDSWWVRLTHEADAPQYRCLTRDVNTPPIPAGAARWRWLEDDETTWVRCEAGCCTTQ